jgi:hypothetical protein
LPILADADHLRAYRVEDDVPRQLEKVSFLLNEDRFASSLEDMSRARVASVEPLSEDAIDMAHATCLGRIHRLDEHVIVIAHQAVRVTEPVESIDRLSKDFQERRSVIVIEEDVLPSVPPSGNRTRVAAQLASYSASLSSRRQTWVLDPQRSGLAMASV